MKGASGRASVCPLSQAAGRQRPRRAATPAARSIRGSDDRRTTGPRRPPGTQVAPPKRLWPCERSGSPVRKRREHTRRGCSIEGSGKQKSGRTHLGPALKTRGSSRMPTAVPLTRTRGGEQTVKGCAESLRQTIQGGAGFRPRAPGQLGERGARRWRKAPRAARAYAFTGVRGGGPGRASEAGSRLEPVGRCSRDDMRRPEVGRVRFGLGQPSKAARRVQRSTHGNVLAEMRGRAEVNPAEAGDRLTATPTAGLLAARTAWGHNWGSHPRRRNAGTGCATYICDGSWSATRIARS